MRLATAVLVALLLTGCQQTYYYCVVTDSHLVAPSYGSSSRCAAAASADEVCRGLLMDGFDTVQRTSGPYDSRENCEVSGPIDFRPPDAGAD